MSYDAVSKCCASAGNGNTHDNDNEGNTPTGRQAVGVHPFTTCLPTPLSEVRNDDFNGTIHSISSESGKSGILRSAEASSPGNGGANNASGKSGSSSSKLTGYTSMDQRPVHAEDTAGGDARKPFLELSHDTAAIVHATKMNQAPPPAGNAKPPSQRSPDVEPARDVTLSGLSGLDGGECAAASTPKSWTDFLSAPIPANVHPYEELRLCISPAACASPTPARKAGSTTDPRKGSTGTDEGNPSLSRFETLSTQPSHPRLYTDDVDDCSPSLLLAGASILTQELEHEEVQRPSRACADDNRNNDEIRIAGMCLNTEFIGLYGNEQHAEGVAAGKGAERQEVTNSGRRRPSNRGRNRNSDTGDCGKDALPPKAQERDAPSLHRVVTASRQNSPTSAEGDVLRALQLPSDVATASPATESDKASHCRFMAHVASATLDGKDGMQGDSEAILHLSLDERRKERSTADASPRCEKSPQPRTHASRLQSPAHREKARTNLLDATRDESDVATCSSASFVAPAAAAPMEVASVKVAKNGTGSEVHPAESEEQAPYTICAGDSSACRSNTGENAAMIACGILATTALSDAQRDSNASAAANAVPALASFTDAGTPSGSRTPRGGGALGGEASPQVGPRGRPSLGAAGRQLLLDRIRAIYHTNVGLYSGVLRRNYNSTISKLPFFTVSLLHQLAADFGIDTNAVLEQQHDDSTRGSSARHSAETAYSPGGGGARQGSSAAQARGSEGSSGEFHLRKCPTAESRTLVNDSVGTNTSNAPVEKRRGRLQYEGLSRRRCAPRTTKKSGSTNVGTVESSSVGRGDICAARGTRRRSLGLRPSRTSWGAEVTGTSARRIKQQQQGMSVNEEQTRTPGGFLSPGQNGEAQQLNVEFGDFTGVQGVPRAKGVAAAGNEAWAPDQVLSAGISSILTASGAVRARAVASERRREELGQQLARRHGEPRASPGNNCTDAPESLDSTTVERAPDDTFTEDKWRTAAKVPFLLREQGRDQNRFQAALDNTGKDEGEERHRSVGDPRGVQSCFGGETPVASTNEYTEWFSGAIVPYRFPASASCTENQQRSAREANAVACSYLHHHAASENAALVPWARATKITKWETVEVTDEKRGAITPVKAAFSAESSRGAVCGSPAAEGETTRMQNNLEDDVSLCGSSRLQYLYSVLRERLRKESGRSYPPSAVSGEEPRRTTAAGEKSEEAGLECRGGSERLLPQSSTGVSQQLSIIARDERGIQGTTNLQLAKQEPNDTLALVSLTAPGGGARGVEEGLRLQRNRERLPDVAAANNGNFYKQNSAEESLLSAIAAITQNEPAVAAAQIANAERLFEASARTLEAEHLRKRIKTEALWSLRQGESRKSCLTQQPQPAPSSHNVRNYLSHEDLHDCSLPSKDQPAIADEKRILELLARGGREIGTEVGEEGASRVEPRDAATAILLQKTSASIFKRGSAHVRALGDSTDCKLLKTAEGAPRDLFSSCRSPGEGARRSPTEDGDVCWREPVHLQPKSDCLARVGREGSSDREPSISIDGRLTNTGLLGVPLAPLTDGADPCHRHKNEMHSSLLRQKEQGRRQLLLAAACRTTSAASGGESVDSNGAAEGHPGNDKSARNRFTGESWRPASVDVKTLVNTPNPPASAVFSPTLEHLTASRSSAHPSSCRTSSTLLSCNLGSPLCADELKRRPQQSQQHLRQGALQYNRNKVAAGGGVMGHMHTDVETNENELTQRGWLSRGVAERDTSQGAYPFYAKRTGTSATLDPLTEETSASKDVWPSTPDPTHKGASEDIKPLLSLLLDTLFSEETARAPASNASGESRCASIAVALIQMLSELQRRPSTTQLSPQCLPQQSIGGELADEMKHAFASSPSPGTPPPRRENTSPVQRPSDLDIAGWLSSVMPASPQKVGDRYTETPRTATRLRVNISVEQQLLQQLQQLKQGDIDAAGGHSSWANDKGGFDWIATTQEEPGTRGINHYEVGETSASSCLRRQEPTIPPLAVEVVERFLQVQARNKYTSGYPSGHRPSVAPTRPDKSSARDGSSIDRSAQESPVASDSQGLAEAGTTLKVSLKTNDGGETWSTSGPEEMSTVTRAEDKLVCITDSELGNLRECREAQPHHARYSTLHGSQQHDRYDLDDREEVKKKDPV